MLATLLGGDGTVTAPTGTRAQLPLLLAQVQTASSVKTGSGTAGTVGAASKAVVYAETVTGVAGLVGSGAPRPLRSLTGHGKAGLTTAQKFGGTLQPFPELVVEIDVTNDPTNATRVWTDITPYVRQASWRRSGRQHELQRSEAGTLSLVLDNRDGRFDPTNTTGAYYPGFKRLRWVRVRARWLAQFYPRWQGVVETLRQEWPGAGSDAITQVGCVDAYKILNLFDLEGEQLSEETSGSRVSAVLTLAGVPAGTIDTGQSTLVAANGGNDPDNPGAYLGLPVNTGALQHLQAVEETENGLLIADPDGGISFQDRHYRVGLQGSYTATIGDGAGEIPYRAGSLSVDDQDLWNEAAVTPQGADSPQVATDSASVTAYFARRITREILSDDANEAQAAAEYLVNRYADPAPRLPTVALLGRANLELWDDILALTLSDRVLWRRRPEAGARTIAQATHIEQIAESVIPGTDWTVEVQLSPADREGAWILETHELDTTAQLTY